MLTRLWRHKFCSQPYLYNQAVFATRSKSHAKNLNILKKKRAFFVTFIGLTVKQITQFFLEVESPTLILICDVLSIYKLYYIQFKEVRIIWGPGSGVRIWWPGFGDRITQKPQSAFEFDIFIVNNGNNQKHPAELFYTERCYLKFLKIHRKIPVLESLF